MEKRRRIGELLVEAGAVSPEQLREALAEQERGGGRLCHCLIRLGHLKPDELVGFLREQFGVAAVNLDRFAVAEGVLALLPAAFARRHRIVPLHALGGTLTVAMADPSRDADLRALRDLTGLEVEPLVAPEAVLEAALERLYPAPPAAGGADGSGELAVAEEAEARIALGAAAPEGLGAEDWLRRFVLEAVRRRSREIHLEPCAEGLRVRYRLRGALQEGETAPASARAGIVRQALALAGLAGAAAPAAGRFEVRIRRRRLAATLAAFPTIHGLRLVARILDEGFRIRELQELGLSREAADEVRRMLARRSGLVIVAAPPGHGRMTTLYSLLGQVRADGGRNIMTLECPVRHPVPGLNQTSVGGSGPGFAAALRAILDQEPDVIALGAVPDREVLDLAIGAARSCLVLARCALRDAAAALAWFADAGVGRTTLGTLLEGMVFQRLVPRLCSSCRESLAEPPRLLEGVRGTRLEELNFYAGRGCESCGGTGRAGRLALFEVLGVHGRVRELLAREAPPRLIADEAQRLGMWTLLEDGVLKASQGLLDVREVLEAAGAETGAAG